MCTPRRSAPSAGDPSRLDRTASYEDARRFYQSAEVAADYDRHRLGSPGRRQRNRRKWAAIARALGRTQGVSEVLDLPCGTARFTGALADQGLRVVGADISIPMMRVAAEGTRGRSGVLGHVQADAEALPFRDGAFDCIVCIRFMMHVEAPVRARMLAEWSRVSRRWLIVDYRHRYSLRWLCWRVAQALGLTRRVLRRLTRSQVQRELAAAGFRLVAIEPVTRGFSDKWVVVGERVAA
jgi:ubiquinone/menaquinone biosynthesis C-methylase UbiE